MPSAKLSWFCIRPSLESALSPLPAESRAELLASIKRHKIRDPIKVIAGTSVVLDGHHRLGCAGELGIKDIPYEEIDGIESEQDALNYVYAHQIGRRNATPAEMSLYRGRLYNSKVAEAEGKRDENIAETVAEATGVSRRTVMRDAKHADAFDRLSESLQRGIEAGAIALSQEQILVLSKLSVEAQNALARDVRVGNHRSWKAAIKSISGSSSGSKPGKPSKPKGETKPKDEPKPDEAAKGPKNPKKPKGEKASGKPEPEAKPEPKPEPKPAEIPPEPSVVARMDAWNSEVESLARKFVKFSPPEGAWVDESRWGMVVDALRSAAETLRGAKGAGVCPACSGKGCKKCRSTGFAPKQVLASIGASK